MGSLFKPDLPDSSTYYTPTPYTPPATTPTEGDTGMATDDGSDAERAARVARRRSFPETIQTSWRGVLQQNAWIPQRKSLLGE